MTVSTDTKCLSTGVVLYNPVSREDKEKILKEWISIYRSTNKAMNKCSGIALLENGELQVQEVTEQTPEKVIQCKEIVDMFNRFLNSNKYPCALLGATYADSALNGATMQYRSPVFLKDRAVATHYGAILRNAKEKLAEFAGVKLEDADQNGSRIYAEAMYKALQQKEPLDAVAEAFKSILGDWPFILLTNKGELLLIGDTAQVINVACIPKWNDAIFIAYREDWLDEIGDVVTTRYNFFEKTDKEFEVLTYTIDPRLIVLMQPDKENKIKVDWKVGVK